MKKRNIVTLSLGVLAIVLGFLYPLHINAPYWRYLITATPCSLFLFGLFSIALGISGFVHTDFLEEECPLSTTLTATAISFVGACGFVCLFNVSWLGSKNYPIAVPAYITLGTICGILAIILGITYIYFRAKWFSSNNVGIFGIVIDLFIVIFSFYPFITASALIINLVEYIYHAMIA